MPYDRQLVIQLDFDNVIEANAKALNDYGNSKNIPSRLVKMHGAASTSGTYFEMQDHHELVDAARSLTKNSRVYLEAHGDWQSQKLGIHDPLTICDMLADSGMPEVKIVSVLGCSLARDAGTANDLRISHSVDSFASKLHELLGYRRQLHVKLYARVYNVHIGAADWGDKGDAIGRKFTANQDDQEEYDAVARRRTRSKIQFYWENGQQRRAWAY
jgi:hypothetical protein